MADAEEDERFDMLSSSSSADSGSDADSGSESEEEWEMEEVLAGSEAESEDEDHSAGSEAESEEEDRSAESETESDDEDIPIGPEAGSDDEDEKFTRNPRENIRILEGLLKPEDIEELDRQLLPRKIDRFDFPKDPEKWREEDLRELWGDAPCQATKIGWDPYSVEPDDVDWVNSMLEEGRDPPIAPFYVPFRKFNPIVPKHYSDIKDAKTVIEELDRIEEFLNWVSYIFPDGSSYEGTVWDDMAHGKGVYISEAGLVRYEGEWLQNHIEGHGVIEVDIPTIEPLPGSRLEKKMRAEGAILKRDFMSPEDREWLEMDIEDSLRFADSFEIPFYENKLWVDIFGQKPEKGRYRYAGEWKHGRMHGCGVYEVNERIIYGRFYFGEFLEDEAGCDEDASAVP